MKYLLILSSLLLGACSKSEEEPTLLVNGVNHAETHEEVNVAPELGTLEIGWDNIKSDVNFYLVTEEKQLSIKEEEVGVIKLGSVLKSEVNKFVCNVNSSYTEVTCSTPGSDIENIVEMTELVSNIPQKLILYIEYVADDGSMNLTGAIVYLN